MSEDIMQKIAKLLRLSRIPYQAEAGRSTPVRRPLDAADIGARAQIAGGAA